MLRKDGAPDSCCKEEAEIQGSFPFPFAFLQGQGQDDGFGFGGEAAYARAASTSEAACAWMASTGEAACAWMANPVALLVQGEMRAGCAAGYL